MSVPNTPLRLQSFSPCRIEGIARPSSHSGYPLPAVVDAQADEESRYPGPQGVLQAIYEYPLEESGTPNTVVALTAWRSWGTNTIDAS